MSSDFEIKRCRSCGSENLKEIIDLGEHYISNFVGSEEQHGTRVPLTLVLCNEKNGGCGLLQLKHNAPPEEMWGEQYWYKSGINPTIRADLKDIVENAENLIGLDEGNIVVDIGCNDGTMFDYFSSKDILKVGFEPSKNVAKEGEEKAFKIITDFFSAEEFEKEFPEKKAKIITAISMFYDLENPNKFLEDIKTCLDDNGLFIIQQNYLVKMLENNGLDNICHEHREYYSFRSLKHLLERHGLKIFDVVLNGINGGSIRTYIRKKGSPLSPLEGAEGRMEAVEKHEIELGLNTSEPYENFAQEVNKIRDKILRFINEENSEGKTICASGASTKGNTTLQYFGLGPDKIKAIEDKNSDKFGKKTVGTLIPIDSPEEVDKLKPDYLFVLIWYFLEDVKRNQRKFLENGGKLIVPLPVPKVISIEGEELL